MTRTVFGRARWVGGAAAFLVGLAMVLALALTAGSAGAEPCADCDPGGGGGGGNVAPTVSVAATSYTVNEGGSVTLSGAYDDADGDTVTVTVDADNNNTYESDAAGDGAASGTWSYTFSAAGRDGPASQTVNIKASDSVASRTTSTTVNVVNVAPTATFNAPASVDEGSSIALSLTNATDPSSVDRGSLTYRFDCGAGFGLFTTSNTASCPTNDSGTRTVKGQVRDKDGGITEYEKTVTINDITAPLVTGSTPTGPGVARNAPLTATFSEQMNPGTLTKATFRLFKVNSDGTTTRIFNTTVTPSTDGLTATLDPFGTSDTLLRANTKYKAIVTTGAEDLAGNALDQNSSRTGNQSKVWTFTTGGS